MSFTKYLFDCVYFIIIIIIIIILLYHTGPPRMFTLAVFNVSYLLYLDQYLLKGENADCHSLNWFVFIC